MYESNVVSMIIAGVVLGFLMLPILVGIGTIFYFKLKDLGKAVREVNTNLLLLINLQVEMAKELMPEKKEEAVQVTSVPVKLESVQDFLKAIKGYGNPPKGSQAAKEKMALLRQVQKLKREAATAAAGGVK